MTVRIPLPGPAPAPLPTGASLLDLAARLSGRLLRPGHLDWAEATAGFNLAVVAHPIAVVEAANAQDVVTAVRFAARHGIEVTVRATGHGATGHGATGKGATGHGAARKGEAAAEQALLVRTGRLDECTVHPEGWARVGAGVRWHTVLEAAARHGLAPLAGGSLGVGVVGYLTGGGLGPVARTYGIASDRVRAFDVVTGDGVLRRATPHENADLFWGLRGGKGALGVVTAVEFDLLAIDSLYAGALHFDGAHAARILTAWREWCAGLPPQATTSVALLRLPQAPGVPALLAGRPTVAIRYAWTGALEAGRAALAPMRHCARPLLDGVGPMPYTSLAGIHADPVDPMPFTQAHLLLDRLPQEALDTLLRLAGPGSDSPQFAVELRQLGGAIARVPERPSAVCHRDAAFGLGVTGPAEPPAAAAVRAHAAAVLAAMRPWSSGRTLANFDPLDSPEALTRAYEAETLRRLRALAAHHDPHRILAAARWLHGPVPRPRWATDD